MARSRIGVVVLLVVLFLLVGGVLIYRNQSQGGGTETISATVTHANSMSPSALNAHLNDTLTMNITSDTTGEVHLHGYNIPFDCTAGQVTSHRFKADKSGQFEIEWESTSTHLGFLVVS
jgi:hypothetical protein